MKIWLDFCEPKSITMLRPLYEKLIEDNEVLITARDFDSTHYLLNEWGVDYTAVGKYGGGTLTGKLEAYSERLSALIKVIIEFDPKFLFCITSPEAMRISFGLQIPNIMFNDEPRSYGPCKTTFPYVDQLIVPHCIPLEWYLNYGLKVEKIIRFNGIDEVGWLSDFKPNEEIIKELNLEKDTYIVCRTEPTKAGYLADKMKPHETQLTEIIPSILESSPDLKILILTRNNEQFNYLNKFFAEKIKEDILRVYQGLSNLADIMYYSKLVITGGGTMVRESALLGIPSIEFIPLETYPQEQFLIDNGFPLKHFHNAKASIDQAIEYIAQDYKQNTFEKIKELDNPIEIGLKEFNKRINVD
jgi:predicted glycosyltransferase